jgi:hypothetical protein
VPPSALGITGVSPKFALAAVTVGLYRRRIKGVDNFWLYLAAAVGASRGRFSDSDSASLGSNPSPPARFFFSISVCQVIAAPSIKAVAVLQSEPSYSVVFLSFTGSPRNSVQHERDTSC